ncbi:TetR/AcrR family transcriptional regulator [Mycolicibacterium sp. CH28]|uniref:TetR/AcrR family transcriptional regulator n=1 Tax=Mycolicibacterium sp. CH28 TaxID=2512237 RepID=UPI001080A774|nr:TetR/AcrR family transcriptional regulator [Mycolicibacterium sp. CH28]TGD89152.1 TetR/AcrR family transcriptional regulator [Mycolicibacterium sp. CH28]
MAPVDGIGLATQEGERSVDSTCTQILRAACQEFATRPYSSVSLEDILARAHATKGAMYAHFGSKRALAEAIIGERSALARMSVIEVLGHRLSGLETVIDVVYRMAVQDYTTDIGRAARNLTDSIGRIEGVQADGLSKWVQVMTPAVARARDEGDVLDGADAEDVARLIISVYFGTQASIGTNDFGQFLSRLERNWQFVLPGFAEPDRIDYLTNFIRRRTAHALNNSRGRADGPSD